MVRWIRTCFLSNARRGNVYMEGAISGKGSRKYILLTSFLSIPSLLERFSSEGEHFPLSNFGISSKTAIRDRHILWMRSSLLFSTFSLWWSSPFSHSYPKSSVFLLFLVCAFHRVPSFSLSSSGREGKANDQREKDPSRKERAKNHQAKLFSQNKRRRRERRKRERRTKQPEEEKRSRSADPAAFGEWQGSPLRSWEGEF